jgi:hypothetical protein
VRLIPQAEPLAVGAQNAKVGDVIGIYNQPSCSRLFEPSLQHMPMLQASFAEWCPDTGRFQKSCKSSGTAPGKRAFFAPAFGVRR